MYPVSVLKQSGRAKSSSGGKDYHLILIQESSEQRALVIQRWGRKGQWGVGWKLTQGTPTECTKIYRDIYAKKLGRDYDEHFINKTTECTDEAALRAALGIQTLVAIGGNNMSWLLPGEFDVSAMKVEGQGDTEFEEGADGRWRVKEKERRTFEQVKEPEPAPEERIAANSRWGTWG